MKVKFTRAGFSRVPGAVLAGVVSGASFAEGTGTIDTSAAVTTINSGVGAAAALGGAFLLLVVGITLWKLMRRAGS